MQFYLRLLISVSLLNTTCFMFPQTLEELLEEELGETTQYAVSTFHSTRIINGPSVERMPKNGLDFRIAHRFGKLQGGFNEFWGIDESSSYFSLEYGVNDWLMAGIGRATYNKTINSFLKASVLKQCSGKKNIPVSLVIFSGIATNSTVYSDKTRNKDFDARLSYTHQLLIARKMNSRFSLQLSPTFIHRNVVKTKEEKNDLYALGLGSRYKITPRVAATIEYYLVEGIQHARYTDYFNPVGLGVDIQAGSHVFQIFLTNSLPMTENCFIGETQGDFFKGDIRIGFNISQVFTLNKK